MRTTRAPLPPRLARMAAMVPGGSRVADVGSDHGLLAIELLRSGRAAWCVATERTPERLAALARCVARAGEYAALELRAGDGLAPLTVADRLDVVVVGGVGAGSVAAILDGPALARVAPRRLVVQPQTDPGAVRRRLATLGWEVVDEALVGAGGRTHLVIAAEPFDGSRAHAHPTLSADDLLEAGPCLVRSRDPAAARYWRRESARLAGILRRVPSPEARARRELALRVLAALGDVDPA